MKIIKNTQNKVEISIAGNSRCYVILHIEERILNFTHKLSHGLLHKQTNSVKLEPFIFLIKIFKVIWLPNINIRLDHHCALIKLSNWERPKIYLAINFFHKMDSAHYFQIVLFTLFLLFSVLNHHRKSPWNAMNSKEFISTIFIPRSFHFFTITFWRNLKTQNFSAPMFLKVFWSLLSRTFSSYQSAETWLKAEAMF